MQFGKTAQGSIEYLIIIAIVVVIGLVVTSLSLGISTGETSQIGATGTQLGNVSSGGITIVDAVADPNGDALLTLKNNTGEPLTLTSISSGDTNLTVNELMKANSSKSFDSCEKKNQILWLYCLKLFSSSALFD